jgi:CBS domain-containing protein/uncharacterized protein (DUF2267 family)
MSLERFRRRKMVVLNRRSMAYQAARAMADNHIGSVLVSEPRGLAGIITDRDLALAVLGGDLDPKTTPLDEVMSEDVVTCDIGANVDEVARLMREHNVRRIPLVENGQLAGLITFDDLIVDGSVGIDVLRSIVTAQLEVEAPHKPAGLLHPQGPGRAEEQPVTRARALVRAKARADATYNRLVGAVASGAGLDRDRAERALLLAVCMLCRRLTAQEAQHLIAQLPSRLQPRMEQCLDGPDRSVTTSAIETELGRALAVDSDKATTTLQAVCRALADTVSKGQIDEVRGQLPEGMKQLFPAG